MITVHQHCDTNIGRDTHQAIVYVISDDDRVVTIATIDEICWKDGLVVAFILIPIHVIYLQSVAREGKEQHITRSGIAYKPLQPLQDVHPSRLLGSIYLH
jgi:hypothetical protein